MKPSLVYPLLAICLNMIAWPVYSQTYDQLMPVRGVCLAAPQAHPESLNAFHSFIDSVLVPKSINTLILRVDYNYQYTSHPELQNEEALSKKEVKELVAHCKTAGIRIIPQINLFGHQSWHTKAENLLAVYPQFDETPHIPLPEKYEWPNEYGLYCKSYCPLHPDVHEIVFGLVDELVEAFETDAFHAGLDEVFYIGDEKCPRCGGRDKAELFAGEVNKIHQHLQQNGIELWMWGDRLLDGKTTGIGMWEASMNNTHKAIDLISKEIVICDWHYKQALPTAAIFAAKGFRVISCPWNEDEVAAAQVQMIHSFRQSSTPEMKEKFMGMIETIWTSSEHFIDQYYGKKEDKDDKGRSMVKCFNRMVEEIALLVAEK